MHLQDYLQEMTALPDLEARRLAIGSSAYCLFERNAFLPLDVQAQGIALLVDAFLHEQEPLVRSAYTWAIRRILFSRPYQGMGTHIAWDPLIRQLPHLASSEEIRLVLFLLKYSQSEQYLPLLESYFGDAEQRRHAVSSWISLMATQHYTADQQAREYLHEARKLISRQYSNWHHQAWKSGKKEGVIEQQAAKVWTQEVLAFAQERIEREVTLQDRRALEAAYYEQALYKEDPWYFPTQVKSWLALPTREEKLAGRIGNLDWVFEKQTSIPTDEIAQGVQVLVDYALTGGDRSVASTIWAVLPFAFETRIYVGTYLDWDQLASLLTDTASPSGNGCLTAEDQRHVLSYFGYAPHERYLDLLYSYLEHEDPFLRKVAVKALPSLLVHVAHYCPQAILLRGAVRETLKQQQELPDTPETWRLLRNTFQKLEQDIHPYFHYYKI